MQVIPNSRAVRNTRSSLISRTRRTRRRYALESLEAVRCLPTRSRSSARPRR